MTYLEIFLLWAIGSVIALMWMNRVSIIENRKRIDTLERGERKLKRVDRLQKLRDRRKR